MLLRGIICMMVFAVGLLYTVLDLLKGDVANLPYYLVLLPVSVVAFLTNRRGHELLTNVVLLVLANTVAFLFASNEGASRGTFFFFITNGLGVLVLFGYRNRVIAYLLVVITYLVALFAYLGPWSDLTFVHMDEQVVQRNFIINFTAAFSTGVIMIYFAIKLHHDIESSLSLSEQSLLLTSDELKKSRERFQLAVEGTKAGIYEINTRADLVTVSIQFEKILGYHEHELSNVSLTEYQGWVHPEDRDARDRAMQHYIKTGEPYQVELRMKMRGGSYKWVTDSGVANEKSAKQSLFVGSIIDIEERKMAERQIRLQNDLLAKTNEELDRFVYSTSHDLRAPLSSLLGLIMLAERTNDPAEVQQCLQFMKQRVETLDGFIKEITDYSRNSRLEVDRREVDIATLLAEVTDNLKYSTGASSVRIVLNLKVQVILTDVSRLKVVLNNLIANAIKYRDTEKSDPIIDIGSYADKNFVYLAVKDNGVGISDDHIGKIFNMFYRASNYAEGSGLGLYIVKETLTKMGGEISASSELGKGTTFIVKLAL